MSKFRENTKKKIKEKEKRKKKKNPLIPMLYTKSSKHSLFLFSHTQ
jgi:hypothetical protein